MTVQLYIKKPDGSPLPGTVTFQVGQQAFARATGANGLLTLDTEMDGGLLDPGNTVMFSAPGYYQYSISAGQIPGIFTATLTKKPNTAFALGLGALAAVALSGGKGMIGAAKRESKRAGLPGWVLPAAGLAAAAGIVLYIINRSDPKAADSAQLLPAADSKLQTLKNSGMQPTLSTGDLENMSSVIVQATDDCGTDEDAIYRTFAQLQNDADMWALIKQFGVRQIKSCFGGNYFSNTPYNLPQIITSELSTGELETLNNILQQIGITYRF